MTGAAGADPPSCARRGKWQGRGHKAPVAIDRRDCGSVTVVAVGVMAGLLAFVMLLGFGGRAFAVHSRAEGTADLAALAAADAARGRAPGDPCDVAKALVKRAEMEVSDCIARPDLGRVKVVVKARLPAPLPAVKATAVAGGNDTSGP